MSSPSKIVFFAKNVKSSLKIGHARGAVLIAAVECGLEIFEYSPLEIKKAVAGYGSASKEQVRSMIRWMLKLHAVPPARCLRRAGHRHMPPQLEKVQMPHNP